MKYVHFHLTTEYCGTESDEYAKYSDSVKEKEIDEDCYELARNNAESYEHLCTGWHGEDLEDYTEEEREQELSWYYDEALSNSYWEFITKEEYEEGIE